MKRVFAVVFLSLLVLQLCLLPMAVTAKCLGVSTVTLPVTNITDSTATLNGTWTSLEPYPSSFLCVSFQYSTVPGVYTSETPQIAMSLSETGTFPFQANISGLSVTEFISIVKISKQYLIASLIAPCTCGTALIEYASWIFFVRSARVCKIWLPFNNFLIFFAVFF